MAAWAFLPAFRASLRARCSASSVAFFLASLARRLSRFEISLGASSSSAGVVGRDSVAGTVLASILDSATSS